MHKDDNYKNTSKIEEDNLFYELININHYFNCLPKDVIFKRYSEEFPPDLKMRSSNFVEIDTDGQPISDIIFLPKPDLSFLRYSYLLWKVTGKILSPSQIRRMLMDRQDILTYCQAHLKAVLGD